jgi:hypothetical protein
VGVVRWAVGGPKEGVEEVVGGMLLLLRGEVGVGVGRVALRGPPRRC